MIRRFFVLVIAVAIIVSARPAAAQVLYGSILGTVTDQSGAVVPKAHVTVFDPATHETREALTDEAGRYSFPDLPAATYEIKVTAAGFRLSTRTNVIATINNVTRADVQIEVGAANQEITVAASSAVLQTDTSDVHTNLNPTETSNLPLPNYRNYQSLINLVPGATPTAFQNSVTDTPQRSLTTNVNGTNRNNNNTRVDGAGDVFVWLPHHTVYVPPEETIDTVNISTDSFDAEQGMAGGAAITVTTKSGTNQV